MQSHYEGGGGGVLCCYKEVEWEQVVLHLF